MVLHAIRKELGCLLQGVDACHTCKRNIIRHMEEFIAETQSSEMDSDMDPLLVDSHSSRSVASLRDQHPRTASRTHSLDFEGAEEGPPAKKKRREVPVTAADLVTSTADTFLERVRAINISTADCLLYTDLTQAEEIAPVNATGENASRAWEMCVSFAQQSKQKLKYARFLRFLSLCFFLIWERYSEKQGKSAAREVRWHSLCF